MGLFSEHVDLGKRRPFVLCVLANGLLLLTFALLIPWTSPLAWAPYLVGSFLVISFGGEYSDAMRRRAAGVGIPHPRWTALAYGSVAYVACLLLLAKARFFAPGSFVLLNLPLAFLKEKPNHRGEA